MYDNDNNIEIIPKILPCFGHLVIPISGNFDGLISRFRAYCRVIDLEFFMLTVQINPGISQYAHDINPTS